MANFCIMRIKKLHTNANVGGAISHHLRTRETDNADPEKMKKNWFCPTTDFCDGDKYNSEKNADFEIRKKAQQRAMAMYKKNLPEKVRKNAVRAVEFMMTVSPEVMQRKDFNAVKYLNACQKWAREKFGSKNVFFIAQHFDETTPHVSLLLNPIDENGKLNARKFFGGREKMTALQDEFYEKVGKEFGLERGIKGSRAKHQTIKSYYAQLNEQEKNVAELTQEIVQNLPEKKFLQSEEQHQADVFNFVQNELEQIKPSLEKSITAEQTEKRLADLRKNFDGQVRQKVLQKESELNANFESKVSAEVTKATETLSREKENLEREKQTANAKLHTDTTTVKYSDGIEITCENGILNGLKERAEIAYQFKTLTPYGLRNLADRMEKLNIDGQQAFEQAQAKGLRIGEWLDTPIKTKSRGYGGMSMSD